MIVLNACKICESNRLFTVRTYHVNPKSSNEWGRVFRDVIPKRKRVDIRIVLCRDCGFLFYRDEFDRDELALLYKTEHRIDGVSQSLKKPGRKWEIESMKRFLEGWSDTRSIKSALDVGAGDFLTLDALLPLFPDAKFEALDPSYGAPEYRGIPVHDSMLETFSSKKSYELVFAVHILEHVAIFNDFMKKLAFLTEKYLYVEVPYQVGLGLLRNASANAQHINYFTPESLSNVLGKYGFEALRMELDIDGYRHIGMPGMIRAAAKKVSRSGIVRGGCASTAISFLDPRPFIKAVI